MKSFDESTMGDTRSTTESNPPKSFSHDSLLKALYWIYDGFDRAMMGMFLVYKTAEDVLQNKALEGDGVHVGTRRLEWTSGSKTILDNFLNTPVSQTDSVAEYNYEGIPVFIHIFEDDPCITSPNQKQYENEFFKLPNPYSQFMERFGKP